MFTYGEIWTEKRMETHKLHGKEYVPGAAVCKEGIADIVF